MKNTKERLAPEVGAKSRGRCSSTVEQRRQVLRNLPQYRERSTEFERQCGMRGYINPEIALMLAERDARDAKLERRRMARREARKARRGGALKGQGGAQ